MVDNVLSSFSSQSLDLLEFFQTGLVEIDFLFLARWRGRPRNSLLTSCCFPLSWNINQSLITDFSELDWATCCLLALSSHLPSEQRHWLDYLQALNLAQKVSDEALVYVPTKGEEAASQQAGSGAPSSTSKDKKVNLNKASLEELKQVKGLGGKRAQDIIDHREAMGKFKSVDELKKVSGNWCPRP